MVITKKLAKFILESNYEDLPVEAIRTAKGCILDFIGVSLFGSIQPVARVLEKYVKEIGGIPSSSLIGLRIKTSPVNAAMVNGTLGHAIDYDDNALIAQAHPTVTILPAVFALSETLGTTGKDVLLAYILGYETFSKLGMSLNPNHWYRGFHSTGTFGTYAAVTAASKLLNLDFQQITNAFGIAGSEASGLKQNFGTMTKPFHAGHAAEGGVRAALLAKKGFTAANDVLEGQHGFAKVTAGIEDLTIFNKLGNPWGIVDSGGVNTAPYVKPFPSCGATHAAMEAMIELIKEHDIRHEDVEHVNAGMNPGGIESLPYSVPRDLLQAKFSMQFCLAILLLEGKAGLDQFTDLKVRDKRIVDLMKRITLSVDPDLEKNLPLELCDLRAVVRIRMKDGKTYKRTADIKRLSWEEIVIKYTECSSVVLAEKKQKKIVELIAGLEKLDNLFSLMELIRG